MSIAILSVGSNLGNRLKYIRDSVKDIKSNDKIKITKYSHLYETEPVGVIGQSDFYNCALLIETDLKPEELWSFIQSVEIKNGRTREYRWSPRTIDIDIIDYDNLVIETDTLILPHPRMHERKFVLLPMFDIYPDYVHPKLKEDIDTMLAKINGQYCYNLNLENWHNE